MTDTSRSGDLVKRLRYTAEHGLFTAHDNGMQAVPDEAADRIEALEAEVERLRGALGLADAALSGANMNMNVVERKVRAALGEKQ